MRALKNILNGGLTLSILLTSSSAQPLAVNAASATVAPPKTAQEFAKRYMELFNKKDAAGLKKLRYPTAANSELQSMIDSMSEAEMKSGTKYSKFEVLPAPADTEKPQMGPDGNFYQPNLKPTHMLKVIAVMPNGTSSTTFPIGQKNGIFYQVAIEPVKGMSLPYVFGWQKFTPPQCTWSVLMPNEPDPGKAALEKEFGKDMFKNPDIYGVVRNTADIKTTEHFFVCAEEGKKLRDPSAKETFRVNCTTYEPETLKKWFNDPKKNLQDTVEYRQRSMNGKALQQKEIKLGDAPGIEYEFSADKKLVLGRAYWINDSLIKLEFESSKENPDRKSAEKFLNSLSL